MCGLRVDVPVEAVVGGGEWDTGDDDDDDDKEDDVLG
jgi:hypothetical protein